MARGIEARSGFNDWTDCIQKLCLQLFFLDKMFYIHTIVTQIVYRYGTHRQRTEN